MRPFVVCVMIFQIIQLKAQNTAIYNIEIYGKVISQKSLEPIPYAHVVISETGFGTVTNEFGDFLVVLPNKYANSSLKISSIGYESAYMKISSANSLDNIVVSLRESTKFLDGVVITPVDEARLLIEEAIKRIGVNYATEPRSSEGFFRSIVKLNGKSYYTTEANLSISKESYSSKQNRGVVKLNKGRNYQNDSLINKFKLLLYAGPHIAHRFDFVMQRSGPLSKINFYYFSILDTVRYDEDSLVRIKFSSKRKKREGELYVSLKDKVFVKGIYYSERPDTDNYLLEELGEEERLFIKYEANYKRGKRGWELYFVNYKTSFEKNGDRLTVNDVYITTKRLEEFQKVDYSSQLQFVDVFLANTGDYDADFWRNYNIVLPSKEEEAQFAKHDPYSVPSSIDSQKKVVNQRLKMLKQISKLKFGFGVFMQSGTITNTILNYTNSTSIIAETVLDSDFFYYGLSSTIEYYFSPSFFIGLDNRASLAGNKYSSISFKSGYNLTFSAIGRPLCINFSGNVGYYSYAYALGKYDVSKALEVNNRAFDSGEVEVSVESRRWAVEPTIRVSLEMNHRLSLFAESGWNLPFSITDGLHFKEKGQSFWKTKQAFVKLPHPTISLSDGTSELTEIPLKTNFMLNAGVLIHFKF